ncbi:MAG: endopeptidase La [Pseudomonadales bacterium]|nr:endopeptidase La [Pseudomonadales bacterium]
MSIQEAEVSLPLLPLRDVVVYPHMVLPLFVGRESSIKALESAMADTKEVLLVAQKDASDDDPKQADLFEVGTVATILQLLKLPDGTVKVLVEGSDRAKLLRLETEQDFVMATAQYLEQDSEASQSDVLMKTVLNQFEQYVNLGKKVANDVLNSVSEIEQADRLADTIASHLVIPIEKKQELLEITSIAQRLEHLIALLDAEIDLFQIEKRIRGRVKKQMEKSQREYYLNEQIKAIQKELGDLDEAAPNEIEEFNQKIDAAGMPEPAAQKAKSELAKLKMMSPMSAEASVIRTYLDWMVQVPWQSRSKVRLDLNRADKILNQDHFGLDEVKERILEFLAVQKRVKTIKGPVLCLVGPPGVGKTSLGESIAKATNREFVRMALGGVRDEAEIRGHRRTYIGSMPGKLIQKMSKVGVKNPLFLLDEIDKMGMDHRGDPASALLEVLDPAQNHTFNDHYLESDFDLSEVMFICTANSMNIPAPLLDRMEVIRIPGYTEDEKLNIAQRYLIPKQQKNHGLKKGELAIDEPAIRDVVRYYTKEAGVRNLEREFAKIARKVVKTLTVGNKKDKQIAVDKDNLSDFLGVQKFDYGKVEAENQVGLVTGLAWTQVGGELLNIEAVTVPGKGMHVKTGSLGDVMQESIQTAMTVVRSRAQSLGIPANFLLRNDLHIHMPEGATPKDGPSAGIGMSTAMVSVLTGIPVRKDVAMTGEITLRGQVLRIGGLKEKLLAAHRGGIKTVIIPFENERDLAEIPENILSSLAIKPVRWLDEVLDIALEHLPEPLSDEDYLEGMELSSSSSSMSAGHTH